MSTTNRHGPPPGPLPLWERRLAHKLAHPGEIPHQWTTREGKPRCVRCGVVLKTADQRHKVSAQSCARCRAHVDAALASALATDGASP